MDWMKDHTRFTLSGDAALEERVRRNLDVLIRETQKVPGVLGIYLGGAFGRGRENNVINVFEVEFQRETPEHRQKFGDQEFRTFDNNNVIVRERH